MAGRGGASARRQLSEIARRDLPLADDVCVLRHPARSDRLDFAGGLAIAGDEVITVPGLRADAAAFLGHLLVVSGPGRPEHRLLALDPATGDLLHEQDVDAPDARDSCIRIRREIRPYSSGMGQDGVLAYRVDVDGMRVHLPEILAGEIL
ncbi:hypothetical protein GS640_24610 [Rhodococcus hoagii]|nr:hypothetical protein [Prescottella equi]